MPMAEQRIPLLVALHCRMVELELVYVRLAAGATPSIGHDHLLLEPSTVALRLRSPSLSVFLLPEAIVFLFGHQLFVQNVPDLSDGHEVCDEVVRRRVEADLLTHRLALVLRGYSLRVHELDHIL